jgi:hypothetical protein
VDENEPIVPLQQVMDSMDDYGDPNWEPEPVDAGPGGWFICFFYCLPLFPFKNNHSLFSLLNASFHLPLILSCPLSHFSFSPFAHRIPNKQTKRRNQHTS